MKFIKCSFSILSILFALTGNGLANDSNNLNFTNEFNDRIACHMRSISKKFNLTQMRDKFQNQSKNGMLLDVHTKFLAVHPSKVELIRVPNKNISFKISGELPSVSLAGYWKDVNRYISTEKISIQYVVESTEQNITVDFPYFDSNEVKLTANEYLFNPHEERKIKKEIVTHIKSILNDILTNRTRIWKSSDSYSFFNTTSNNDKTNSELNNYLTDTITSTNYTLNNVTVHGLLNLQAVFYNFSNPAAFVEIEIRDLDGSTVQNFPSTSVELNFKADRIYISGNRNTENVNVKAGKYSLVNVKMNTTLADDQSKIIIGEIQSSFAASLTSAWKNKKPSKQ